MKYILIFFIIFSNLLFDSCSGNIFWSSKAKLKWSDFKSNKCGEHIALTASGIKYITQSENDTLVILQVNAIFDKNKSAKTANKSELNDFCLRHEQTHFDISEWYARVFRKALTDSIITSRVEIPKLYHVICKEFNEMQERYDSATNHGINRIEQYKWNDYVTKQLSNYSSYSNTKVAVRIKRRTGMGIRNKTGD